MLCSVWRHGLNAHNIICGFRSTGVFPVDRTKYKLSCLDKYKLQSYTAWKSKGSPHDADGSPILYFTVNIPEATDGSSDSRKDSQPSTSTHQCQPCVANTYAPTLSKEDTAKQRCTEVSTKKLIKLLQSRAPEGMKYHICLMSKDENVSIESVIKSRGKPAVANNELPKKRKRVKMDGSILTNKRFKEQVELFRKESTPKQSKSKKKQIVSDTDEEEEILRHDESDDDEDLEDCDKGIAEDKGDKQVTISNSDIGKYFAVYWNNPRTYYSGKLEKLFRDDVDQQAEKAEFKFLHKKSGIDGEICWDWPTTEDIDIVDTASCFWGPALAKLKSGRRGRSYFVFEEEDKVQAEFAFLQKYGLRNV